jgi:hypothetical protein
MPRVHFLASTGLLGSNCSCEDIHIYIHIGEVSHLFILWIKYAGGGKDELKTLAIITVYA